MATGWVAESALTATEVHIGPEGESSREAYFTIKNITYNLSCQLLSQDEILKDTWKQS